MRFSEIVKSIGKKECIRQNKNIQKTCSTILGNTILYLNHDLLGSQKRILLCYVSPLHIDYGKGDIYHPLFLHINQMIKVLIDMNFSIDICDCNDKHAIVQLSGKQYDYILGFGKVYTELVKRGQCRQSILFITENNPEVVERKYKERVEYFRQRHPHLSITSAIVRKGYFDKEQFEISDDAIVISSEYNIHSMRSYFRSVYQINVNGLFNKTFQYDALHIKKYRNSFVWFGSQGIIHKGLDVLVDAFRQLPECTLNIYGIPLSEIKIIKPLLTQNIRVHSPVNVLSDTFIEEVVRKNMFVLSASCSEGMMSGIATCMLYGLIPIVSKETGYNSHSSILEFENCKLENVISKIQEVQQYDLEKVSKLSKDSYIYAQQHFTLECFRSRFSEIMNDIVECKR